MLNILLGGSILAILIGIALYHYAKDNGRNPNKWFAGGFSLALFATLITALAVYFKKRR